MFKWDERWLEMARLVSTWSKDPSTKVGSVIVDKRQHVVAVGYNGLPRGVEYREEVFERPGKYMYFEHGERNAIYNAAAAGNPTEGCTIYVPAHPCADCARGIIQAGITRVVCAHPNQMPERWEESATIARSMLLEAGVNWSPLPEHMHLTDYFGQESRKILPGNKRFG